MACVALTPLEKMIAEAEGAYHKLMTGQSLVELVDQNGERVRFQSIDSQRLYNYIMQLKSQLPVQQLCLTSPNGPAGFLF